jgi:nicotinate-nucleotide adenylyltransferase
MIAHSSIAQGPAFPSPLVSGLRVGLLGGSFNPAHDGHRHISLIALRRLGLDQVWWLVSPQNPLKSVEEMAPFEERFSSAQRIADHPRIKVSNLEARLGTTYTADLIKHLCERGGGTHFVWLMGADNLGQFHKWKNWQAIFETLPICVIARPGYERVALGARAAQVYVHARLDASDAKILAGLKAPVWSIIQEQLSTLSSTQIRSEAS